VPGVWPCAPSAQVRHKGNKGNKRLRSPKKIEWPRQPPATSTDLPDLTSLGATHRMSATSSNTASPASTFWTEWRNRLRAAAGADNTDKDDIATVVLDAMIEFLVKVDVPVMQAKAKNMMIVLNDGDVPAYQSFPVQCDDCTLLQIVAPNDTYEPFNIVRDFITRHRGEGTVVETGGEGQRMVWKPLHRSARLQSAKNKASAAT